MSACDDARRHTAVYVCHYGQDTDCHLKIPIEHNCGKVVVCEDLLGNCGKS